MPWYIPQVPEGIKKRVCIYLLQRYLGQFFEEKLTLDQLSLDLYNGTGTVANISLDVQALNELGEKQNWPMEFVDGYLEELIVRVPLKSIFKESSFVEVRGLKLTVQPKQRTECATSMFESMWSSMSNSMQLAQECMKQEASSNIDNTQPSEGIVCLAEAIDSVLSRVKVKFINSLIQLEHVPRDSSTGVAVQIKIEMMEYLDEAGNDPPTSEATDINVQEQNKAYVVSSFTCKNLYLEGVTFSTVEFPSIARTFSRSIISQSQIFTVDHEKQDSLVSMIQKSTENEQNATSEASSESSSEAKGGEASESNDEQRHVIMFGKMSGRQEIRIRMKQSENVSGPKVFIESNFGSFTLFLSPRQIHVLLELCNGLASPDLEDTSNVPPRQKCVEKPMTGLDYQRVEQELQLHIHPLSTFKAPGLQGLHGWSTAALEENDDENFLPLRSAGGATMYDSAMSAVSSSMESSLSSSMASSFNDTTSRTRRRVSNIESDPTAEISNFYIRLASFVIVLLHEDLLTPSTDNSQTLIPSSVQQMQNTAKKFFDSLPIAVTGFGNKDFDSTRSVFEKACSLSHLRLLAAPIQIEAKETTTLTAFSVSGKLTVAKLELLECLKNSRDEPFEYVKLLTFLKSTGTSGSPIATKPSLSMTFKHIEKTVKSGLCSQVSVPKTDIGLVLDTCIIDVDITIVDRITALLNPQPVCIINRPVHNVWNIPTTAITSTQVESRQDVKVTSPSVTLRIRFPIPDFRPQHDNQRTPWWKKHVRADFLTLQLSDITIQTTTQTSQSSQKYTLQCRTIDLFYHETDICNPLCIGRAGVSDVNSLQDGFNWPRIVLQVYPILKPEVEYDQIVDPEVDLMTQSIYGNLIGQNTKQPGPFSAKRVVHESDTPHTRIHHDDGEELIIPGDKQEMNDFIELTSERCRIHLEITLPLVSAQLVSKHVYEVLYNRINSDLLLWEPGAPKPKQQAFENVSLVGFPNLANEHDDFTMCKSGIQNGSDSDSEDQRNPEDSSVFYSIYESRMKRTMKQRAQVSTESKGQSQFVLNLNITSGLINLNPPVRDLASNVIPNQHGEFVFNIEDAKIFNVSGYCGDENLGYVCVQVKTAQFHHCDMISTPSQSAPLMEVGNSLPRHLHPTVSKSETGILAASNGRGGNRDMVSIAIKIQASHETHHVKTVRIAVGVNKATLRHRMCLEPNSWITQLIDFFNVFDYPIPGYHAKDVLTELHLHLWDCAIDYRPLHIPLRSVVTLGNFSMSSHLSAQANTSTLRFIAEECDLFLSDTSPPRNGIPSAAPVDLKRDYVNVVELGLFELSLKTNDKKSGINPHIDLRASNNILHIRTCSDSGRALMQLITYFASDGDLTSSEPFSSSGSSFSSPLHKADQELVKVEPQNISKLSSSQHQHVNELLGEAMKESMSVGEGTSDMPNTGAKLFFFPDENHPIQDNGKPLSLVTYELGDVAFRSNKSSDTDDDFCFVGDEAGLGIMPKNGLPEIRWLTDNPIRIVENHFSIPIAKTDLLKPPSHYPTPVLRYTLCEMSVVWHMYGGNDFKLPNDEQKLKKTVNFADVHKVTFNNTHTGEVILASAAPKKKQSLSWRVKGGLNRDHDVLMQLQLNKVRFQHDVYPDHTFQASRQVLLVSELEIRDRLKSSQINKFLYQYTSESRPKQSHANMILIKAVHIRPDTKLKDQECCLRVSVLPLRLHIDQDSLLFLINYFTELGSTSTETDEVTQYASSKHNTPTHQPPVMTVSTDSEKELVEQAHKVVDENLLILLEEEKAIKQQEKPENSNVDYAADSAPIYFRKIVFKPEVPIRLDYHGKRIVMDRGPLPGLLMGLGQLSCSELKLRRLSNDHKVLGVDKLIAYCLHEWLSDIKKNQLPSLLGGVGPMHSLVQLFQGIKDLFWLPIEQYQKDGRIVRGLQRGANSFTKSTVMAALELTSRIIHLVLITAETAYDMMSPGPSVRRTRHSQPTDFREGVANAYMLVKEGIGETADNLVRVASHEHEQKGYSGAVGGVLRQIPPTIMKPIIIASEATNNVLGGVRSQLVPDIKREANEKWKKDEN